MQDAMKVKRIELLHLRLPLVHFFETSFGRVYDQETLIVRAEADGISGFGEVPASAAPRYSYETVQTAWHVIGDFLAPKLRGREFRAPGPVSELFSFVRGHNMAKAGLEMAVLDLFGKAEKKPLWRILDGELRELPAGVSLGIEDRVEDLLLRIEKALAEGYRRIKIKIRPRWDVKVLAAIRKRFPGIPLMVDANGAYRLSDLEHLKRLDDFGLMMIEQPLEHDDYVDHAKLQAQLQTDICLDESIRSYDDARRALELGACRVINIKPARVGGPFNARMIQSLARAHKVPVWCGGLLETGIGRAHNIAVASLPGFTLPGDISASRRYYKEDVIDPPVKVGPGGMLKMPEGPGIGYNVLQERLAKYCIRLKHVLS
jgi:O-succinylbenzoate synthase